MFQYYVEQVFERIDETGDVPEAEIARLEWSYLNVLQHSRRPPKTLRKALSTSPEFFVQVLSVIYRPHREGEDEKAPEPEPTPESEEERKRAAAIASHAYRLLHDWRQIPGQSDDGIDSAALEAWVKEARILAARAERSEVADQHIGRVLAYAPADPDGTWPSAPVRDLIELVRSRSVERGFYLGVVNKRGATWRRPTDGGIQERELAQRYRKLSKALRLEWPRTSAVLEQLARNYARDGDDSDADADRFQW